MSNVTNSPNMNLPIPTVGVDPGPDYANNINQSLTQIDQHDHSAGNGVPVTPAGLNISTDLSFQSNNLLSVGAIQLITQPNLLTTIHSGYVYQFGGDLYYNAGLDGFPVQLTVGHNIVGTPGSITGLSSPASASYISGVFHWQSTSTAPASMDMQSVILRNSSSLTYGLTLQAPALSSNYTLTLPVRPASETSFMIMGTSGAMAATIPIYGALTTSNLSPSAAILGSQLDPDAQIITNQIATVGTRGNTGIFATQIAPAANIAGTQLTNPLILPGNLGVAGTVSVLGAQVQIAGRNAVVASPSDTHGLTVVAGIVQGPTAAVLSGQGFSCNFYPGTGNLVYQIFFTTPFAGLPAISITPIQVGTNRWVTPIIVDRCDSTGCDVFFYSTQAGQIQSSFSVIAIGTKA